MNDYASVINHTYFYSPHCCYTTTIGIYSTSHFYVVTTGYVLRKLSVWQLLEHYNSTTESSMPEVSESKSDLKIKILINVALRYGSVLGLWLCDFLYACPLSEHA